MAKTTTAKKATKKGETVSVEAINRCDASKLRGGDYLSRTSYMSVARTTSYDKDISVKNMEGLEWSIDKKVVSKECYSASQFHDTIEVNRTTILEFFLDPADYAVVRTVNYDKANGENRTMICYVLDIENNLGRSNVIDLEDNGKIKQVDHRTINWLIMKGTRYIVK